jgi:hypothetical protein
MRSTGFELHADIALRQKHLRCRRPWLAGEVLEVFSLVPEPNAEMLLAVALPGEVGETPGATPIGSNMLNRRTGIVFRSSDPKRVSKPLLRASILDSVPSTTTIVPPQRSRARSSVRAWRRRRARCRVPDRD